MIDSKELIKRLISAALSMKDAQDELDAIDAEYEGAKHSSNNNRIADAIIDALTSRLAAGTAAKKPAAPADEAAPAAGVLSIQDILSGVVKSVGKVDNSTTASLWSSWLSGLMDAAPADSDKVDDDGLKKMFAGAFQALDAKSGAKQGDKTLMDAIIPASRVFAEAKSGDSIQSLFSLAAAAALEGADSTKDLEGKYGRSAKKANKGVGTKDAGAVSMASFFRGLADIMDSAQDGTQDDAE
ncbi:MAG: dihydroxyacetone kinase subunit L [Coriobacteriales bacterium]|nr:dihydroxyacetone kinase subunit L [Coriobacteriales bacterium]